MTLAVLLCLVGLVCCGGALEGTTYTTAPVTRISISSTNTIEVPVLMQVAQLPEANVGQQYVLLVEPESCATMRQVRAEIRTDGTRRFRFANVPQRSRLRPARARYRRLACRGAMSNRYRSCRRALLLARRSDLRHR